MQVAAITILCLAFAATAVAGADILSRVPELQEKARLANRGVLGCGVGSVVLQTSEGQRTVRTGLDPFQVFGQSIKTSDLLVLLEARARSNQTGVAGPMSGDVDDLSYIMLDTIGMANEPRAIPVLGELLKDRSDIVRGWSAIALYRMGASSEALRATIKEIVFPKAAVTSAAGRGETAPQWIKVEDGV